MIPRQAKHSRFAANPEYPAWKSVALFWAAFAVLVALIAPLSAAFPGLWQGVVLGSSVSIGSLLLTAWFLRSPYWTARDVGIALQPGSGARFLIGMACGLILVATHFLLIMWFGGEVSLKRVPEVGPLAGLLAVCSVVPLAAMEELGFRGYPLRRLMSSYGLWVAQVTVALAFAIYHVAGGVPWMTALLGTGTGSILFGMAAIATRGLALPIGLHAAWNLGAWALGDRQDPGLWEIVIEESSRPTAGTVGALGYFGVLGFATLGFWFLYRRQLRQ